METQHSQQAVGAEGGRAEHFGEASGANAPVHLHLPHPILGVHEAEREQGVLLAPGHDVRNAVFVPDHLDRRGKPGESEFAVDLRERPRVAR